MTSIVDIGYARRRRETGENFTALKLAALDWATVDIRLTHQDFRLLYFLASATDQQTGIARRKQQVIADALGVTRRGVQISAERLAEFGYIAIETKDGGSYTNGYRLVLGNANPGSPSENTKANPNSPFAEKRRTRTQKKANGDAKKGEPPFAPILPLISLDIPSRARGPSARNGLGPPGAVLKQKIGSDKYRSWFKNLRIETESADTITLSAPDKFFADQIQRDFETNILESWQAITPTISRVVIVVRKETAA
jgi:hypothetical protein